MIISRTPFRISFAGGGSDLKEYYIQYGGAVVSTTIDKYVYLSMHPYFNDDKYFLKYSGLEMVNDVEEIQHGIIRQVFKKYRIKGVDFNSSADIPAGTGLGSSSAFTGGLINLCNAYLGKYISREEIAREACEIEIDQLKEPIGKQDQYACAVGGLNYIEFCDNEKVKIEKILINPQQYKLLEDNLLMFYIGNARKAGSILKEQKQNVITDKKKINNLHKIVDLSKQLRIELASNNIDAIGDVLHAGWQYKKELASKISNDNIDGLYERAIHSGALGGKLLGAGGGGFLLFYVKDEKKRIVRKALSALFEMKFKFDNSGSTIIF